MAKRLIVFLLLHQIEPRYSSSGWPFCPHVISHIPFESESQAKQDGVYRFGIGPRMAELWLFLWIMAMGKIFPLCLEVLLARATSSEELKNYMILTTILQ